ncbi:rhamnan synthesis F family protein [Microbacterium sp. BWT-B31]|uniref:rhamnan synthesis F family protein n=1 Tax=Microbacterium sp. BWT-B31 TaxID=3232072 RepID=UPI003529CE00
MSKTSDLVVFPSRASEPFPQDGRRLLIYVVYDVRGDVEDYIPYALRELRVHVAHILVVVNGTLTARGRAALAPVADEVLERENRGFDIWGYKAGLDHLGESIAEYDEVILANDTWFGPINPFGPVFDQMDGQSLHFWGMTDHARVEPHPFTQTGYLPYHLQSYWIAARKSMFLSDTWRAYWRDLPEMNSYSDAVVKHEGVFTEHFSDAGFIGEVAFPIVTETAENYPVLYARQLLEAGCPTLKRRPFFQWPAHLDRLAVIGRWTLDVAEKSGYPLELIYQDLARNVQPRVYNADAAMLSVLPEQDVSYDSSAPLRTVVLAHIFYAEMTDEMLDRAEMLPGDYDLVVTTADEEKAAAIRQVIAGRRRRGKSEVRVVASNNGRDQGAFLIDCRDVLLDGGYDLVVKIHSKKTPQDIFHVGRHFRRQQFLNLLNSPGYTANVVALFQQEPGLGIVYPPMIHLGHPTLGHSWWSNKHGFYERCKQLGIRVPLDDISPLAPFGSMYIARPAALRILVEHEWTYDDFGGSEAYQDGGLAHILERMPSYAAGELGYHTRTIANAEYFAMSHTALDYKLDQMSETIPGATMDQIGVLRDLGYMGAGNMSDFVRMYMHRHRPDDEQAIETWYQRAERVRVILARLRRPRSWLRRAR